MRLQSFLEAVSEGVLSKYFLKNFAIFTGKNLCCKALFYKVTGFQHTRIQHRCFIVYNTKFLRTPILKNICEPLPLLFSSSFFKVLGKNVLKTKSQKLINKYENTFICTLHAVMKKKKKKTKMCHYEFSCFHAETCTTDMRRATHIE